MSMGTRAGSVVAYVGLMAALTAVLSVYEPLAVSGESMVPALVHGDLVLVRRGAAATTGDIALVRRAGHGPVLHRVVREEPDGSVVTRGDANPIDDFDTAARAEVRGVVALYVPCGSWLKRWRGERVSDTLSAQSDTAMR